jgi:hypothetical protein
LRKCQNVRVRITRIAGNTSSIGLTLLAIGFNDRVAVERRRIINFATAAQAEIGDNRRRQISGVSVIPLVLNSGRDAIVEYVRI